MTIRCCARVSRSRAPISSAARRDDGILTALEASGLNLWGTELVTLSACDTGLGEVRDGEGVYGLRRAFVLAGAETLVMSLWPVSDSMTRETMERYYAALKAGVGRGDALRQAKLSMLKRAAGSIRSTGPASSSPASGPASLARVERQPASSPDRAHRSLKDFTPFLPISPERSEDRSGR